MKLIFAATVAALTLSSANAAWACLPALPQTDAERAATLTDRQTRAWDEVALIVEYEVVRAWDLQPPGARPPYDGDTHVEWRPLRTLRGNEEMQPVEMIHQRYCGYPIAYPTDPGTRLLVYSSGQQITAIADVLDLIPVTDITHAATLEALGAAPE